MDFAIDQDAKSCCNTSCSSCSDEHYYVKLDEDLSIPLYYQSPDVAQIDLMAPIAFIYDQPVSLSNQFYSFITESPPGRTGPDRLTAFQSFLL
jgi:hypothetical protein